MKARDMGGAVEVTVPRESHTAQRENTMTIYRGFPWARVAGLPSLVLVVFGLLPLAGCGVGGGDGAEDTGSLITITQQSGSSQSVNVDVATNDPSESLSDAQVSLTFSNESVVPEASTATEVVLYECTVTYTSSDPIAPELDAADCSFSLTLAPDSSVDADVLLMPLEQIVQFASAFSTLPDHPVEYEAHYSFEFRNVPFDQHQTVNSSPIRFSMANFASTKTSTQ